MGHLLEFLFSGKCEISHSPPEAAHFVFRPEDVVAHLGGESIANDIAAKARARFLSQNNRKVLRDAISFVKATVVSGEITSFAAHPCWRRD